MCDTLRARLREDNDLNCWDVALRFDSVEQWFWNGGHAYPGGARAPYAPCNTESLMNEFTNKYICFCSLFKVSGAWNKGQWHWGGVEKRLRSTALEFLDSCESERLSPENHSRPNFPRQQARNNGFTARWTTEILKTRNDKSDIIECWKLRHGFCLFTAQCDCYLQTTPRKHQDSHFFQNPDDEHPYGYGNMRHIMSLISGVGIFCLGCGVSVYHGIQVLLNPVAGAHVTSVSVMSSFVDFLWKKNRAEKLWKFMEFLLQCFRIHENVRFLVLERG